MGQGSQVELDHRQDVAAAMLLQLPGKRKDLDVGVADTLGVAGLAAADVEGKGSHMDHMEDSLQEEEAGHVQDSHMDNAQLRRQEVEGRQERVAIDVSYPSRRS